MKILAIMGSPRVKGDSVAATKMVEEEMKKLGKVDFEYLFLRDAHLGNCIGCHNCILKDEQKCPLKDDRDLIMAKMAEADGVIFVSPVYCLSVTTLLKNFFDHLAFLWHRPSYFGKKAMGITTGGGQFKETLSYIRQNTKSWGFEYVCGIGVPHFNSLKPKFKEKTEKSIRESAEKFYLSVKENKTYVPTIGDLVWFKIWRINSGECAEPNPPDNKYWKEKGWLERDYYYDVNINPIKKLVSVVISKIAKSFMSKVYIGY